jgi:hypothetical protein
MNSQGEIKPLHEDVAKCLANQTLLCAFGSIGLNVSAALRHRIAATLQHEPIYTQACKAIQSGDAQQALRLLDHCIEDADETSLCDPRYFGVFWQKAVALQSIETRGERPNWNVVLQAYARAIVEYPCETRSNHYLKFAELLKEHRVRSGASDSAAILKRGIESLQFFGKEPSKELLKAYGKSELPRTNDYRPLPFHCKRQSIGSPLTAQAGTGISRREDWIEVLLEATSSSSECEE